MEDEYIIISKTAIQKRIKGLEKRRDEYAFNPNRTDDYYRYNSMLKVINEIISQSTPLIPEIEKAYTAGMEFIGEDKGSPNEYISNLKLDI
jgi:hypothetical protein